MINNNQSCAQIVCSLIEIWLMTLDKMNINNQLKILTINSNEIIEFLKHKSIKEFKKTDGIFYNVIKHEKHMLFI